MISNMPGVVLWVERKLRAYSMIAPVRFSVCRFSNIVCACVVLLFFTSRSIRHCIIYSIILRIVTVIRHARSSPIRRYCIVYLPSVVRKVSYVSITFVPQFWFCYRNAQFGMLNIIPLSFWLSSSKPSIRHIQSSSFIILLGLLLSGDIHLNPGPTSTTFNLCTLNIRSLLNPLKYTAIADLAETRNIDVFALTETWITPSATSAELRNATPRASSSSAIHVPH